MPMDETDKRLVNGLMWIAGVCVAAYFLPWIGYQSQLAEEDIARKELGETAKTYVKYYPEMAPAVRGEQVNAPADDTPGIPMLELREALTKSNKELDSNIDAKQKDSRMDFPEWTKIPATYERHPGGYFVDCMLNKQSEIDQECHINQVYCDDREIGFKQFEGITKITETQAIEYLRELYIAEEFIHLCVEAKVREEKAERARGEKPEAYMRIVEVAPEKSVPDGPTQLINNPEFSEAERAKNPLSPRGKKYRIKKWPKFIQEYPVRLVLQCDSNSFQRFLYSVRQTGHHFLVIRNLEIVSPYIAESEMDKAELLGQDPTAAAGAAASTSAQDKNNRKLDSGHIQVTISAAGMDFFDPLVFPNGLSAPQVDPKQKAQPKHVIPAAPAATPHDAAATTKD